MLQLVVTTLNNCTYFSTPASATRRTLTRPVL